MATKATTDTSTRLLLIESFVKSPPNGPFAWGYLSCLMDEASEDIDEAGSDIFELALHLFSQNEIMTSRQLSLMLQRTRTLAV